MRVIIDPACNIEYASFYLHGLHALYGKRSIRYNAAPFRDLPPDRTLLAFVVIDGERISRVIIDHNNLSDINEAARQWCQVYGKVNLDPKDTGLDKVVAIGPLTGIRAHGIIGTVYHAISNYIKGRHRIPDARQFFSSHRLQLQRPTLHDMHPGMADDHHIFFASSLWKKEPGINAIRANFIKACKSIACLHFEGGFAPRVKNDIPGFEELTMHNRISEQDFFDKTRRSSVVFNTPSIGECNGWKTAEFLMMGKAILSTPIVRVMPGSFKADEHMVFTDGTEADIREKLSSLLQDKARRQRMEQAARAYYEQELAPERAIMRLMDHLPKETGAYRP